MRNFKVGFSVVNANPPLGIGVGGYFIPRFAKGFIDDIEVKALVLELGKKQIAMISIDTCGVGEDVFSPWVENIEKTTGISKENIFLSATHSHTAPVNIVKSAKDGDEEVVNEYARFLGERVVQSVQLALSDLKDAKMGYIVGYAPERVAYIRRYKMKDGTTFTCPPIDDPNIDHPIGELDQRVNVLRFDRNGGETVVLVNYGLHADTVNGELLSSDWPGWMARTLDKALDGVKCIFFNGCEGDVGSTNVHPKDGDMNDTEISFDNEMKSPGMARFIGRALAGTVLQVYDKVKYVDVDDIDIKTSIITVPSNMPRPEDMPLAKKYKELHEAGRDDEIPFKAMQLTTAIAEALRMCRLEHGPESYDIKLTGLKIGPVALLGLPGEPFTEIGVEIKKTDGFELIMPCALTNGRVGYFPVQSAYDEGGYEAKTSPFKSGVADRIINGARDLLGKLK